MISRRLQVLTALPFAPFAAWWGTWFAFAVAAKSTRSAKRPLARNTVQHDRLDVVIPAHNEAASIETLLESLALQTSAHKIGTILVVADHCTDNTADLARRAGAEVFERSHGDNGKPLAIRDGFAMLADRSNRGEAVVVIDGDCVCEPEFIERIAACFTSGAQAVQAAYTVEDAKVTGVRSVLSSSFGLRNVVRASGANRLGIPVGLFGSGMAFRYDVVKHFSFTDVRSTSSIDRRPAGTDVTMWLDLLDAGITPVFANGANVIARTPDDEETLQTQRLRWERAQKNTRRRGIICLAVAIGKKDWRQVVALIDWLAPPLVRSLGAFSALTGMLSIAVATTRLPLRVMRAPALIFGVLAAYIAIGTAKLEGIPATINLFAKTPAFLVWKLRLYQGKGHS